MVSRADQLMKLMTLNAALGRWSVEPLFTDEVAGALSKQGLRHAVKLTEAELVRATRKLAEQ